LITSPVLAANFGAGGPIDFTNIKAAGANLANNGIGLAIAIFVLMIVIGVVAVIAQQRGKAEILAWLGAGVIGAVAITAFIAWGTGQANAALF
jgi:threonine/homoserine/homoserine lactone efflux protein